MAKLSILQIIPALNSGGVERGVLDISQALINNNINSFVASSGGKLTKYLTATKHFCLPLASKNPLIMIINIIRLILLIKKYNIDIIHARSRAPAWSAYLASIYTGCKFVTTFHGVYNISSPLKRYYNSIMLKSQKIIAVSNFIKHHIIDNYSVDIDKIIVIHRGADLNYFDPSKVSEQRVNRLLTENRIDKTKSIIILPARLTRWKGHLFFLHALSRLKILNYQALIVGDHKLSSNYYHELLNLSKKLNLVNHLKFIDAITDMPALYNIANLVIVPSTRPEAFGRVVIEAQAMGKPVIATNLGGACETIIPEITGWLVKPDDHQQLADQITSLLTNSSINYLANSRVHIEKNFSNKLMIDKTIELYEYIAN